MPSAPKKDFLANFVVNPCHLQKARLEYVSHRTNSWLIISLLYGHKKLIRKHFGKLSRNSQIFLESGETSNKSHFVKNLTKCIVTKFVIIF